MSLNVGELVATLTIDDSRFTGPLRTSERQINSFEQVVRQATSRVDTNFRDSARQVDNLGTSSQNASRDVSRVGQSASDISRIGTESRQAARQIDDIGTSARTAADDVGDLSDSLDDAASGAGDSGDNAGQNFLSGFSGAVDAISSKAGPVAGSILGVAALGIGAGIALANAIREGMEQELSRDLFQAQTKTTEAQAAKFALAAAEAYSDVFGSSVEENLSTLKLGLQNNLLDPAATQRDAEAVIASLETISAALDGDVATAAQAAGSLVTSGLVKNAQEASDLIAAAAGGSANKQGDLLESIREYSSGWKNAGISAQMALALIEQSTDNGSDSADRGADAIREFGRRVSEEGDTIVSTLNDIDLNGQEMYESFKKGGPEADAAFDKAFDAISKIEDPVKRNTAAMGLLGDTAGDFLDAFTQWDPSKAVTDFGDVEGAAGRLAGIMGGNPATSVEGAMRSIGTVADGMKGALAEAFGPQIAEWANAISNNRAGVIEFFIGIGNAGFDAAEAVLQFVEGGLRGLASFAGSAGEAGASFLDMGADILSVGEAIPGFGALLGIATGGAAEDLRNLADSTRSGGEGIRDVLTGAADGIRDDLIPAVAAGQVKFNEFTGNMKLSAAFNDESAKVSSAIAGIGIAADGATYNLENFTGAATDLAPAQLTQGIRAVADGFREQVRTGLEAGNTVDTLTAQYHANYGALMDQLQATGMSEGAAKTYLETLGLTPAFVETAIRLPGMPEAQTDLDVLRDKVHSDNEKNVVVTDESDETKRALASINATVLDGKIVPIDADDEQAKRDIANLTKPEVKIITAEVRKSRQQLGMSDEAYASLQQQFQENADGGINEAHDPQIGDGKTVRIWNEPETGGESYIPHALAKRGRAEDILSITAKKFGFGLVKQYADGGVVSKDGLDASMAWAQSMDPAKYGMGGFSADVIDCSGAVSGAINKALGLDAFDSRMSTVTEGSWLQARGAILGRGPEGSLRVGWWDEGGGANGHTALTYPDGTNFESNGSEGVVVGGPTGADDPSFDQQAWFPMSGDLGAESDTGTGRDATGVSSDSADSSTYGLTDSGALLSTDGDRVFVTNWPDAMGGSSDKPSEERQPIFTAGLKVFANGGFEDHSPVIVRGGDVRMFGEPETEGESYIPHAGSKRPRATGILSQTATKFGYRLVPMADGGLTGFGGYQDSDRPTLDIGGRPMSANKQRASMYALAALGIGGLNTLASGFDGSGQFTRQFDTGSNSPAFLETGLAKLTEILEAQLEEQRNTTQAAATTPKVEVEVNVTDESVRRMNRSADLSIMTAGLR